MMMIMIHVTDHYRNRYNLSVAAAVMAMYPQLYHLYSYLTSLWNVYVPAVVVVVVVVVRLRVYSYSWIE